MATFYNNAIEADAKNTPWTTELVDPNAHGDVISARTEDKTHDFVFHRGKDAVMAVPQSIMNEHVGINYRTIYNAYNVQNNIKDFTPLDDYLKCMNKNAYYQSFLKDKQNPTYSNILKYYSNESFDKYGLAKYKIQDFIYLKYYNQIPNNYMVTLRRYPKPCEDHMFGIDFDYKQMNVMNDTPEDYYAIATAVTYLGEQTGNKLSDILKFEYGANWEKRISQVTELQNPDGGLYAQMTSAWGMNADTISGTASMRDTFSASGIGQAFALSVIGNAKGIPVSEIIASQHRFPQNEFLAQYGEEFYGDINAITEVSMRSRGLTFSNSFSLTFEYSLKSLKCVNPRVAMMDILSNFLLLTGNYGSFWGGATIFYGARSIAPQFGNPKLLRDGKYGEYLNTLYNDVKSSLTNFVEANKNRNDGEFSILGAAKSILTGGLQALLGNLLGGNIGVAGESQAPPALLSGKATGYWHLTIGNPLDPIAMMGNMKIEKTTVEFNDVLGYDDFPTEIKFTVELEHARPRDNAGIENMFNGNKGRFYVLSKEIENTFNINDQVYQNMIVDNSTQEANYGVHGVPHSGNAGDGPFTNGQLKIIGAMLNT